MYNRAKMKNGNHGLGSSFMKILLPSTIALSAICAIATLNCADQPKFEVASVKRMDRGITEVRSGVGEANGPRHHTQLHGPSDGHYEGRPPQSGPHGSVQGESLPHSRTFMAR